MEETTKLIALAHAGDGKAREKLVLDNTGLVWSVVRRFLGRGCEPEDLYQIGCIGLLKAVDKFNLDFEVKFSTYAVPMIAGEIKRFLRDDGMIRVSRSLRELGLRARSAREELLWELGREPQLDEIAGRVGASREEIAASLEAGAEVESLYKTIGGDDQSQSLIDRLPDEREDQEQVLNRLMLEQLLGELEDQEREIIVRRYFENQTQSQIAADFHISQVQVSRLEKRILRRLREYLNA
ncbi:MAG: SigB/SigF/SigG family RNA polymerase sigma factor [Clostridiales bacterium]|nr:SigB/SigF/SigG family RNA polymerase sigma factor [Clostridiales bacterium]